MSDTTTIKTKSRKARRSIPKPSLGNKDGYQSELSKEQREFQEQERYHRIIRGSIRSFEDFINKRSALEEHALTEELLVKELKSIRENFKGSSKYLSPVIVVKTSQSKSILGFVG